MKILIINKFLYPRGGDATYALTLKDLLCSRGHEVIMWGMHHAMNPEYPYENLFVSNVDLNNPGNILNKIKITINLLYSFEAKTKIEKLVKMTKPDIVHLNNFAHQISPSILDVFKRYKIPVVMTTHDYKLVCASYFMISKERNCERCKNGKYFQCFLERCVKGSIVKSLICTMEMYLHHSMLHLYDYVDIFIAPSQFIQDKMKDMGFKGKIVYLPNFIDISRYSPQYDYEENSIVYFGRLSPEKGLITLINSVDRLPGIKLKIIGSGNFMRELKREVEKMKAQNVVFLGHKTGEELKIEVRKSMFSVMPSQWYENSPFSIIESFALGKPVVGSRIGGIPELVIDGKTGWTFIPGDSNDLRSKLKRLIDKREEIIAMGKNARLLVEKKCSPSQYYETLINVYKEAIVLHD